MKKIMVVLFIACMLLAACGAETPAPITEAASAPVTKTPKSAPTRAAESNLKVNAAALKGLEISVWHPWYGVESSLFHSLVEDFNASNEWGIAIRAEGQVNFANLYENVTAALPTKNKPNMAIALPEHALEWDENKTLSDLAPYISDPMYGMDTSDIPALFLAQDRLDKKQIALPAQRTARVLLWNETWAKELGYKTAPAAADDFRKQACGAQKAMLKDDSPQNDYMGGWLVDTEPMTAYAWMLAFEGGVLEGEDYRFLTPNNIETFKFLRELSEQTCAWQANVNPVSAFANRQALFISASLEDLPSVARAFAELGSRDTWSALAFPGAKEDALVVYGSSYVILDSSAEENLAAWLFIRWLMQSEQDARFVEATHLYPIRAATMELLGDYKKTHPQWAQAVELLPQGKNQPQLASWRKVKTMLGDGFLHMYRVSVPSGQTPAILAQMELLARELSK